MKIEVKTSDKIKKSLNGFPKVFRRIYAEWAIEAVKRLKISAQGLRKTAQRKRAGGKTGDLARNIGYELNGNEENFKTIVGTGVGGRKSIVYAWIQDKGGIIRKKDKMLTIPLGNTLGRVANYPDGFFIRSKKGNVLYCQRDGKKLKPLFVLKDQVELEATRWFSGPMEKMEEELKKRLLPENVFATALKYGVNK